MHIEGLMDLMNEHRKNELRKLIELKAIVGEKYLHQKDETLHGWVLNLFENIEAAKDSLPVNKADMSPLNAFFLKMLYAKTNH